MKFKEGQIVYYVDPFIFTIEKVKLSMAVCEDKIYWIDEVGAYLSEDNLFQDLNEAKRMALNMLHQFYYKKQNEIKVSNPDFSGEYYGNV